MIKKQNISFKKSFDKAVLESGKALFENGAVTNIKVKDNMYKADIKGVKSFRSQVTIEKGSFVNGSCSCELGKEGKNCQHLAALLYALTQDDPYRPNGYVFKEPDIQAFINSLDKNELLSWLKEALKSDGTLKEKIKEKHFPLDEEYYALWIKRILENCCPEETVTLEQVKELQLRINILLKELTNQVTSPYSSKAGLKTGEEILKKISFLKPEEEAKSSLTLLERSFIPLFEKCLAVSQELTPSALSLVLPLSIDEDMNPSSECLPFLLKCSSLESGRKKLMSFIGQKALKLSKKRTTGKKAFTGKFVQEDYLKKLMDFYLLFGYEEKEFRSIFASFKNKEIYKKTSYQYRQKY
ncbi:MAG: hypothetical protein LKJ88_03130 [Bacilli bacterium]|jgi:hypothetical protein|nr:hypothetical protein [Bacilli bacterium]